MEENINAKLKAILSGMGSNKLKNSADLMSEFVSSKEGQRIKNSLSESDKKAILEKFMKLDTKAASEKLKNADMSKLQNLSMEDIMKKLK